MKSILFALIGLGVLNAVADGIPQRISSNFEFACDRRAINGYDVKLVLEDKGAKVWVLESGSVGMNVSPTIEQALRAKNFLTLKGLSHVTAPVYQGKEVYRRMITFTNATSRSFDFQVTDSDYKLNDVYKNCRSTR